MKKAFNLKLMTLLVVLTNVMPPLAIDEFTPSMPHMLSVFGVDASLMQLTITVYLLGFALSQAIGGMFSDRFGRRRPLLITMPIFIIGTLVVMFSHSMSVLLLGRVLQGFGMGVSALTGPALMADCFEGDALTKVSGVYSTVYSFIPISAPVFGGFIQDYFGWRANFVFMLILAVVIYAIFVAKLDETHHADASHKLSLSNIVLSYKTVLTNKNYMLAVSGLMLVWSSFMVFSVMAPFIIQERLGYSASSYGLMALLVGLGFFVGNALNNFLVKVISPKRIIALGVGIIVLFSVVLLVLPLLGFFNAWTVMVPIFVMMVAAGFTFPHLYAIAVAAVTQYAGVAGALIGSLILVGATIITAVITRLHAHSMIAMASVYLTMALLAIFIVRWLFLGIDR